MRISRLVLHTPPMTDAEARGLAEMLASDLAGAELRPAADVRVEVPAPPVGSAGPAVAATTLRESIVAAVLAALGTTASSEKEV